MTPTPEQQRAIHTTGVSLLVSAGAGGGKTAVLAERCVHLVTEARPPSSIDRLLVVTFTDAAAAEMRARVARVLRERQASRPNDPALQRQAAMVGLGSISTLHAFCHRLLARFFAQAGLDASFQLLNANDALLLRRELIEDLFRSMHARVTPLTDAVEELVADMGPGGESAVRELVINLSGFLDSVVDPGEWLSAAAARFDGLSPDSLRTDWSAKWREALTGELADFEALLIRGLRGLATLGPHGHRLVGVLAPLAEEITGWLTRAASEPDGVGAAIVDFKLARKPPTSKSWPADERAQAERADSEFNAIRDALTKRLKLVARFRESDWAAGLVKVGPHIRTLVALTREFRARYQEAKSLDSVVDFADLERLALGLLRDPADPRRTTPVAEWLHQRYDHVLVDEFQDINPIQNEILQRLSHESDPARPDNLFAVGDVKQSIYRFRMAEPGLFLNRAARAGEAGQALVSLSHNFRSRKSVLDFINQVFGRLMSPELGGLSYGPEAALRPGSPEQCAVSGPDVEIHLLDAPPRNALPKSADDDADHDDAEADEASGSKPPADDDAFAWERIEREACATADRMRALHDEGVAYDQMAVLMRSPRRQAPLFVRTLERRGIPVHAQLSGGFLDALEVMDLLSLLSLLDNVQQDIPLAAYLLSPLSPAAFTPADLTHARLFRRTAPFHAAVERYAAAGPRAALRERLAVALGAVQRWREAARRMPLPELVALVLHDTAYLHFVGLRPAGAARRANVLAFCEHARRFGGFRRQGLHRFLEFVEALRDDDSDLGAAAAAPGPAGAARLMSIHAAKGLEFPVVFLLEIGKRFNLRDVRDRLIFDRELGLAMPVLDRRRGVWYPTLAHRLASEHIRREALAEELRVLYVALTRARQRLILVGTAPAGAVERARVETAPDNRMIPIDRRLQAQCYLDWLLPAALAGPGSAAAELVTVRRYTADEMSRWSLGSACPPDVQARCEALASIESIAADVSVGRPLAEAMSRLSSEFAWRYPFEALTRRPGVVAASAAKRWAGPAGDEDAEAAPPAERWLPVLAAPRFLSSAADLTRDLTAIGLTVHSFMEQVDLSGRLDGDDLRRQAESMVSAARLTPDAASLIDFDDLAWFFATPLGGELRRAGPDVQRESPFVLRIPAARLGGAPETDHAASESVLVRGIIDCCFDGPDGLTLLDYKTDRVTAESLPARAALYAPQLELYAEALQAASGRPVARRFLVFLKARAIWPAG